MSEKTESPALLSPEKRTQLIKRVCLAPHITNADIDAINAAFDAQEQLVAFRQQVAAELAAARVLAVVRDKKFRVGLWPEDVDEIATRLGLASTPPLPSQ